MANQKVVTDGQVRWLRQAAVDKGVTSALFEEHGIKGGVMSTALDAIKLGRRIRIVSEIKPPEGGRTYTVHVRVKLYREWQAAVSAAGPNTLDSSSVRKVGDLYLPTGTGVVESEIILVNFGPRAGSFERAIEWAAQCDLRHTDPRRVFAIGEHKPKLHLELGMDPMYVAATRECTFEGRGQLCCVWWGGSRREAGLGWTGDFGLPHGWFAFASD